jgi:type II secretory pathway pseudopilin PulG
MPDWLREILVNNLGELIIGVITVFVVPTLLDLVRRKEDRLATVTNNEYAQNLIRRAGDIVRDTVQSTEQTVVNRLKGTDNWTTSLRDLVKRANPNCEGEELEKIIDAAYGEYIDARGEEDYLHDVETIGEYDQRLLMEWNYTGCEIARKQTSKMIDSLITDEMKEVIQNQYGDEDEGNGYEIWKAVQIEKCVNELHTA